MKPCVVGAVRAVVSTIMIPAAIWRRKMTVPIFAVFMIIGLVTAIRSPANYFIAFQSEIFYAVLICVRARIRCALLDMRVRKGRLY